MQVGAAVSAGDNQVDSNQRSQTVGNSAQKSPGGGRVEQARTNRTSSAAPQTNASSPDIEAAIEEVKRDLDREEQGLDHRGWLQSTADAVGGFFGSHRSDLEIYLKDELKSLQELEAHKGALSPAEYSARYVKLMGNFNAQVQRMSGSEAKTDQRWNSAQEVVRGATATAVGVGVTIVTGGNVVAGAAAGFGTYQALDAVQDIKTAATGGNIKDNAHVSLVGLGIDAVRGKADWAEAAHAGLDVVEDGVSAFANAGGAKAGLLVSKAVAAEILPAAATKLGQATAQKLGLEALETTARGAGSKEIAEIAARNSARSLAVRIASTASASTANQVVQAAGQLANATIGLGAQGKLFSAEGRSVLAQDLKDQTFYLATAPVAGSVSGALRARVLVQGAAELATNFGQSELHARLFDGRDMNADEAIAAGVSSVPGTLQRFAEHPLGPAAVEGLLQRPGSRPGAGSGEPQVSPSAPKSAPDTQRQVAGEEGSPADVPSDGASESQIRLPTPGEVEILGRPNLRLDQSGSRPPGLIDLWHRGSSEIRNRANDIHYHPTRYDPQRRQIENVEQLLLLTGGPTGKGPAIVFQQIPQDVPSGRRYYLRVGPEPDASRAPSIVQSEIELLPDHTIRVPEDIQYQGLEDGEITNIAAGTYQVSELPILGRLPRFPTPAEGPARKTVNLIPGFELRYHGRTHDLNLIDELMTLPEALRGRTILGLSSADPGSADNVTDLKTTLAYLNKIDPEGTLKAVIGETTLAKEGIIVNLPANRPNLNKPETIQQLLNFTDEAHTAIVIHSDAGSPVMLRALGLPEENTFLIHDQSDYGNVKPLLDIFRQHSQTTIVWAHAGGLARSISPGPDHLTMMEQILSDRSLNHVMFDLSWDVVAEHLVHDVGTRTRLAGLVNKYPTRFLFGSDAVASNTESGYFSTWNAYFNSGFLDLLRPQTREQFLWGNTARITGEAAENLTHYRLSRRHELTEFENAGDLNRPRPDDGTTFH